MGRSVIRCNLVDLFIVNGLSCPKRKVRENMSVRGLVTVVIGVVAFVVIDSLDMLWGLRKATCGQALR